ncbi:hypothetical protein PoB_005456600 [Plakobranchus ocellatus]|uniref:Uncharacterized protein n=1 Tax=Plakobranchus ocellatus TaxID=259542 RepID=A0AAV4BY41_9GAST|nr:hypothetical protein PoB_005456600 [Plakobranchus ocellatus]
MLSHSAGHFRYKTHFGCNGRMDRVQISLVITVLIGGVGGTVARESALRSAGTLLSQVRAPPPAPLPDGGP